MLANPGQYQVMFSSPLPLVRGEDGVRDQVPGRPAFARLVETVAACLRRPPGDPGVIVTATMLWQQLHGTVSLRISRPFFPWPPLAETITDAVGRLLAGARASPEAAVR